MGHHHSAPKSTTVVNNGTVFNPHATNNAVVNADNIGLLQNLHAHNGAIGFGPQVFKHPVADAGLQLQNLACVLPAGKTVSTTLAEAHKYYGCENHGNFNIGLIMLN